MTDPVLPIVHMNGTSQRELLNLRQEVVHHLLQTLAHLSQMTPHMRDYYLEEGRFTAASSQHDGRLLALTKVLSSVQRELDLLQ